MLAYREMMINLLYTFWQSIQKSYLGCDRVWFLLYTFWRITVMNLNMYCHSNFYSQYTDKNVTLALLLSIF